MKLLSEQKVSIDLLVLDRHVEHFLPYNYGNPAEQGIMAILRQHMQGKNLKPHIITTAIEQYAIFCNKTIREGYEFRLEKSVLKKVQQDTTRVQRKKEHPEREAALFDLLKEELPKKRNMIHHYISLSFKTSDSLKCTKHDHGARYTTEAINKALTYLKEMQSIFYECYQPYFFNPLIGTTIRLRKEEFLL